ncbi:voltage-dependent calcium channel subunit alpha-2/delta-3-like [Clytia hemisphaerica]|uniref:VWFA domain-containing protein n=1 Tax=Clytia hemisphaerica TaxID=252671 RepID=A0A7M5US76_9CNID
MDISSLLFTIFAAIFYFQSTVCSNIDIQPFANSFDDFLKEHLKYDKIESELQKVKYIKRKADSAELVQTFKTNLETLFKEKEKILDGIKTSIENAKLNYTSSPTSNDFVQEFDYNNMRDEGSNKRVGFVDDFSTEFKVNLTHSFVQVPTNIYKFKQSVLQQVEWSQHVDNTFQQNYAKNSNLQYQYYGDSSGVFRIFPGNVMPVNEEADLFDCRRRIWYIQASTSPKDIVIVIDYSGSMIGNNIGIAKITTSSLIDTLQENDYFNVITINKDVTYLMPCVTHLIQATKENKEMFKNAVSKLTEPTSIVDVDFGMDEAFKIFNESKASARCNKAIMFVTDGIEGTYAGRASFERHNKDKKVRVFSYLVGRIKNPDQEALVKMACDNNGHFYSINTLGNVWDTVLDYLRVMSRPITHSLNEGSLKDEDIKTTFTSAYKDNAGFGMVMSASKSVFEKEKNSDGTTKYKHLIGVAGTDISLKNLSSLAPYSKLGVFGRGFVINNNGFVLTHPNFRQQKGYLPVPPNILIEDLEHCLDNSNHSVNLKENMLGKVDIDVSKEFSAYWNFDDNKKYVKTFNQYAHDKIVGTDFVAAVAVTDLDSHYLDIDISDPAMKQLFTEGVKALDAPVIEKPETPSNETNATSSWQPPKNFTYVEIAPWNYCPELEQYIQRHGVLKPITARQMYEVLSNSTISIDTLCKSTEELLNRLLVPAGAIDKIIKSEWTEKSGEFLDNLFIATSGGYQKMFAFTNKSQPFDRDVVRSKLFENVLSSAAKTDGSIDESIRMVFGTDPKDPHLDSNEPVEVTVTRPFWEQSVLAAVSGITMRSDKLNQQFITQSSYVSQKYKENNSSFVCAMIDDFGYIIASNQGNKYTGRFIGERVSSIIPYLNMTRKVIKDTQAECEVPDDDNSSANLLLTPAKLLVGCLSCLAKSVYWLTIQAAVLLVSLMQNQHEVSAGEHTKITVSCVKDVEYFRLNRTLIEAYGARMEDKTWDAFKCPGQCTGKNAPKFRIQVIPGTNVYLLEMSIGSDDSEACENKCFQDPYYPKREELRTPKAEWCVRNQQNATHYRKQPIAKCYNETSKFDHAHMCGRASMAIPSFATMGLLVLGAIWVLMQK